MTDNKARNTGIAIVALTAILVIALALGRAFRDRSPHIEPDRSRYPVTGLDLSSHNGVVNFDSLSSAGIDFVFIKASEGVRFRDSAFGRNYAGARRTGIPVGAYHFFRFDCDGRLQAINLLNAVNDCRLDLPLAIDVEESGNPASTATELIVGRLQSMVAYLQAAGHEVIIYTNKTGDARFMRRNFDNSADGTPELWICSFTDPPLTRRPWLFWQHSHCSRVPGIKGKVDMNTFNGSRDEWNRWIGSRRHPQ
ncbi:MAG: hypothetical protein K2F91_08735 [Muribaculaceae bacterium]|nr:hypothetical protein [Muribaculaceae bacterium]